MRGWIAHQTAGERVCGWCVRAEKVAALSCEAIPAPSQELAEIRRAELARETALFEASHPHESKGRWLKPVPPAEPEETRRVS